MINIRPTVTIGIPAYNEYENLKKLLVEIFSQNTKDFNIESIYIMSDGSTDKTSNLVNEFNSTQLRVLGSKKRIGKPSRINQLFKIAKTDLVIIFDADIDLSNNLVLESLVHSSTSHQNSLISGFAIPSKPITLSQKVAYAGVQIWDRIRLNKKQSDMFRCEGSIRAFPKSLYKKIVFPSTSADEAFSYIKASTLGGGFFFNKKAKVYYNLPKSFKDYFSQQRRYSNSKTIQEKNFNNINTAELYGVKSADRFWSTVENFKINPFYTFTYLVVITFVKISVQINPENHSSLWEILTTTK